MHLQDLKDHARRWHGFTSGVEALKAMAWLVGLSATAVVYGLDDRYASKAMEAVAITTWEITMVAEVERVQAQLCSDAISTDYRSELNRRLAWLVEQYRGRKDAVPYIPACR